MVNTPLGAYDGARAVGGSDRVGLGDATVTVTDETGAEVRDVAAQNRFVIEQDGELAELVYATEPGRLILVHTEVPEALGGHGIGGRLVRAAVDRAAPQTAPC